MLTGESSMAKPSRLYTFLDDENGFSFSVLDGRELIAELAVIRNLKGSGFEYFKNSVLTALPMISFLKSGEGFGLYIDSEKPYFRLKIEANSAGNMRTLLFPENFNDLPKKLNGQGRLSKIFDKTPYTSIIRLEEMSFSEVVNSILKNSYQVQSEVHLIDDADFSVLIMKLPEINVNKTPQKTRPDHKQYWMMMKDSLQKILGANPSEEEVISKISALGSQYLHGRDVQFHCPCSKERMIANLKNLMVRSDEDLFDEGANTLQTHCEYCNKDYVISKEELTKETIH